MPRARWKGARLPPKQRPEPYLLSTWLAPGLLVAIGRLPADAGTATGLSLSLDTGAELVAARHTVSRDGDEPVTLLLVGVPPEQAQSRLKLDGPIAATLGADSLDAFTTKTIETLESTDPISRARVLDWLARCPTHGDTLPLPTSQVLRRIRDGVRKHAAVSSIDPHAALCISVDALLRLDDDAFYIEGWVRSRDGDIDSLLLISPEGLEIELGRRAHFYSRPDVAEFFGLAGSPVHEIRFGFVALAELPYGTQIDDGWICAVRTASGISVECIVPVAQRDRQLVLETIVGDIDLEQSVGATLRENNLLPSISRLQNRLTRDVCISSIDQHGDPPVNPAISIVVPVYRRIDFLEHQLAQFVLDPDLHAADLIYVLDSPEDASYLRPLAAHLHRLYRIPFRIVTLNRNAGYALANNQGATLARAPMLLLLNSDVFPECTGWTERLIEFHGSQPSIGALSPMLLYEDDSLQFAGLYFERPPGSQEWANEHYFKGLHRTHPQANISRPVPAVTGACMLIDTQLYRDMNGFSGDYVQGDYEDTDLCLRLREAGYDSWYCADVALYHLEGQSYPSELRRLISVYNRWLHTRRHAAALQTIASTTHAALFSAPE